MAKGECFKFFNTAKPDVEEAIILAGGLGTRLREVISDVPKPLAPVMGEPFLDILLTQLKNYGKIRKVILAIGYQADKIKIYYQNKIHPFELLFSEENTPLGTGGALKQALTLVTSDTVWAMNGDSYFDLSFAEMETFHEIKNADLTIACLSIKDAARYGSIRFNSSFQIEQFAEKSEKEGWINGGIYLLKKELLNFHLSSPFSLEKEVFPNLLTKRVFAYPSSGKFIDIGTKETYQEAQKFFVCMS